ncbi:MAG: hypothetical protein P0S96_01775 [Simkaniaceae bacterium]|nr:hypothetical protein [Candidatus Sacchlamyda saccharinae]
MVFSHFNDISTVYRSILLILSIGLSINALEDLKAWPVFSNSGLLSWKVGRLATYWKLQKIKLFIVNFFLNDRSFKASVYLRIFGSALLFVLTLLNHVSPLLIYSLFFLMLLTAFRSHYGLNGAYQMFLVLLFALSIAVSFGMHSPISVLCLWFIAGELSISYFIAGVKKLISPLWRNSHALNMIFSTKTYGHAALYKIIQKNTVVNLAISWSIFLFEMAFVFAILLPTPYTLLFCVFGLLFHLSNAIFMGLNDFFFAFTGAYPAFLYCASFITLN